MNSRLDCVSALGEEMVLEVIEHGESGAAKEFIVAAPKFNFKKWLILTVGLSFISLTCELYISDLRVLGLILSFLCFALLLKLHRKIKLESLLVVSSLGLQHTTLYASGRRQTFFLSRQRLKSLLIVEGITMQRVLFYLAIVLNSKANSPAGSSRDNEQNIKNEQKQLNELPPGVTGGDSVSEDHRSVIKDDCRHVKADARRRVTTEDVVYPLFQSLWPRLDVLTVIYRGVEKTLFP